MSAASSGADKPRIGIVIQARTTSTRLPRKVLTPVQGKPALEHLLRRMYLVRRVHTVAVATSTARHDDDIEHLCQRMDVPCVRGSLDDVLARYVSAAEQLDLTTVVRITGDCPMMDPQIVDDAVDRFLCAPAGVDYLSTSLPPTFPDGMDVEVFTRDALLSASEHATLRSEREHVTPYIWKNSNLAGGGLFCAMSFRCQADFSHLRLTVDEPADLELYDRILESLGQANAPCFSMWDIIALLTREPGLLHINSHIRRNEGYNRSLERDHPVGDGSTEL